MSAPDAGSTAPRFGVTDGAWNARGVEVEMSQHEDYRRLARDIEMRARLRDGICRDVLLSIADACEALVRHQQVFES